MVTPLWEVNDDRRDTVPRSLGQTARRADNAYVAALALARCISISEVHDELQPDQRQQAVQFYADHTMSMLHDAMAKGFHDAARLATNTEIDHLRDRDDFKALLAELEKQ